MENASKEWNGSSIYKLVEDLKKEGWLFSFIGAGENVLETAKNISVTNTLLWDKTIDGTKKMFIEDMEARACYSRRLKEKITPRMSDDEILCALESAASEYYKKK